MLLTHFDLVHYLNRQTVKGVIHIGAHHCEELDYYRHSLGIQNDNIIWIEGSPEVASEARAKFPQAEVLTALCSDEDGKEVEFMMTSNEGQSSSILPFGTHTTHHPHVLATGYSKKTTITLDTLLKDRDLTKYNMINIDVQGAEKLVLSGGLHVLSHIDFVYAEVNEEELYKGCPLLPEFDDFMRSQGFERKAIKMTEYKWGDALYIRSK